MVFKSYIIDYHSGSTKWHQPRSWIWANQDWGFNQPLGLSHQEISTLQFALEELIVSMLAKCCTQYWLKFETCCFGSYKFQRCGSVQCKMQRVRNGKMANHRVPRWSDNGYNGARPGPEQIGESLAFLQSAVEGAWCQDGLAVIFLGGDGGGWNSIAGEDPSINWQNWRKNPKIPAWNHRIFHLGALFFSNPQKVHTVIYHDFRIGKKQFFFFVGSEPGLFHTTVQLFLLVRPWCLRPSLWTTGSSSLRGPVELVEVVGDLFFQPQKWDEHPQLTNMVFWVRFKHCLKSIIILTQHSCGSLKSGPVWEAM